MQIEIHKYRKVGHGFGIFKMITVMQIMVMRRYGPNQRVYKEDDEDEVEIIAISEG